MALDLKDYLVRLENEKQLLKEEETQDNKVLDKLNAIRNHLNSTKTISKENARQVDARMNAYWKQISKSELNLETKKTCGSLIQTIKTMAQTKAA
jgi:hypothetical protein